MIHLQQVSHNSMKQTVKAQVTQGSMPWSPGRAARQQTANIAAHISMSGAASEFFTSPDTHFLVMASNQVLQNFQNFERFKSLSKNI